MLKRPVFTDRPHWDYDRMFKWLGEHLDYQVWDQCENDRTVHRLLDVRTVVYSVGEEARRTTLINQGQL